MEHKIDWEYLFWATRSRVYLLWAFLAIGGFLATHYYQRQEINFVWFLISVVGLGYMFKVMPLRIKQMRKIFLAWAAPIAFGMVVSVALFYQQTSAAGYLIVHLGAFWLAILAAAYMLNGLVDPPSGWYWFAAFINLAAAVLIVTVDEFILYQYLVAAVISAVSMLSLWIFRSDV